MIMSHLCLLQTNSNFKVQRSSCHQVCHKVHKVKKPPEIFFPGKRCCWHDRGFESGKVVSMKKHQKFSIRVVLHNDHHFYKGGICKCLRGGLQ